jgi:hypothetical protein
MIHRILLQSTGRTTPGGSVIPIPELFWNKGMFPMVTYLFTFKPPGSRFCVPQGILVGLRDVIWSW